MKHYLVLKAKLEEGFQVVLKVLTEASGSLVSSYLISAVREAGYHAVASDISPDCVGRYLADSFVQMPKANDEKLWHKVETILVKHSVDVVIPSFDEMLLGWAERKDYFRRLGITVICSEANTIKTFQDKWLTYQFFTGHGIPTPKTSLKQDYPLIKPRMGRGAKGISITSEPVCMDGCISQEVVNGQEFTIDVLCDKEGKPIYIVPRIRQGVKDGKSTGGVVVKHPGIHEWVEKVCRIIPFQGPVNFQCIVDAQGNIKFIEINPRIAGGMALGFAATENWVPLLIQHFVHGQEIKEVQPVQYGMMMRRYYAEVFVPPDCLGED